MEIILGKEEGGALDKWACSLVGRPPGQAGCKRGAWGKKGSSLGANGSSHANRLHSEGWVGVSALTTLNTHWQSWLHPASPQG